MWFLFAFIYAVLIAIVIVFDRYVIKNVFTNPVEGLFITIPTSIVILLGIAPLITWPQFQFFLLAFFAGCFLQFSQISYFHAMEKTDETGDLSAIESSYPILVAIISVFIGQYLNLWQWIGILIIVTSVILITKQKTKRVDTMFFLFIGLDIIFLALHAITADYVLDRIDFLSFLGPYNLAIIICGFLLFLLIKKGKISTNWMSIRSVLPHLCFIEVINIIALISATYALSIGHAALVTVVMSTYPAFVFFFCYFTFKEGQKGTSYLARKVLLILLLALGLGFVTI
ncbi:MAG: EamA family transporter [bacterium]|nr:EamA family transporter [bacterium]